MSNKEEAAAAKKRGNAHYAKQEWDAAIAEYTKAIGLYDKDHSYYSNRSACYAATDKFDEALADGRKCVEIKPDWAKGYGRVGYALFKLDKLEEAKQAYEDGLKIDGNNSTLTDGLNQCESAMNKPKGQGLFGPQIWQTISLDPELRPYMNDQAFVQKINMLNANPQMAMQMGVLNDPKIKKVFEKLMGMSFGAGGPGGPGGDDNDDDDKSGDHVHSDACSHGHNPYENTPQDPSDTKQKKTPTPPPKKASPPPKELTDEEKQQLLDAQEEEKKCALALNHKEAGNALYKQKKFADAIVEYRTAQELNPKKASYVLNESAALFMLSQWDECITCCERAVHTSQTHFDDLKWCFKAYNRMGSVEEKRGKTKQAIEYYKKALVELHDDKLRVKVRNLERQEVKEKQEALYDPELAEKLKQEGNVFFSGGKFAEAIEKYTQALLRNVGDHKIYSNRAICFCKLMRWDAAMSDCDEAIKLEPLFIKAYIRKGKVHHCLKEYHKALEAYKQAEAIDKTVEDLMIAKRETLMAIQRRNQSGGISEEEKTRALQDPEVQAAMNDPEVSSVLLQAQSGDQTILYKAMRDRPHIKDKIELLMAAGVLRLG